MVADVVPFDAVLQSPTFSLIHRLKLYHQDPAIRSILYLNGGAEEFEDIPKEIQGTDELLLLKNLTVTPLEFKQWVDSTYVKYAVTRVFFLPKDQFATNKEVRKQAKRGVTAHFPFFKVFNSPGREQCVPHSSESVHNQSINQSISTLSNHHHHQTNRH